MMADDDEFFIFQFGTSTSSTDSNCSFLGTKMADKCVDVFHCGTNAPGWLLGGHPTNASQQAVWKTVCFSWDNNCCYFKGHIQVRECKDFFVYHLKELRVKYLRYCGNDTNVHDANY